MGGSRMHVLNQIWHGEISPMERRIRPGSEYQKALVKYCDKMDAFLEALPPEAKAQAEALEDLKCDLNMLAEEDMFLYGFRLGAGMMLDILEEQEGQFRSLSETR